MTFDTLGLPIGVLRGVAQAGYAVPTPVQAAVIPIILQQRDMWVSAETGSGKTAAFVLPLLALLTAEAAPHQHERALPVRALIVAPTRELAAQIADAVDGLGSQLAAPLKTCVAVGGVSIQPQLLALREGADVVVATPGRLLDLVAQNALSLSSVTVLVLDEADRLLSLGFADALRSLLALLPSTRQTLLFSATFPPKVVALAETVLRDPQRVNLNAGRTPQHDVIQQRVIEVDADQRTALLTHLLHVHAWPQALVFVASRAGAESLSRALSRAGVEAWPLHGELSQGARSETLSDFKSGRIRVLVATDLAARGLDIAQLPAVLNFDLPRSASDYAHRIGRTGRAGARGLAVSFVSADTAAHFQLIEKRHRVQLVREQIAGFVPQQRAPVARDVHGGIKGKRKSKKDKLREAAAQRGDGTARDD